MHEMGIATSVFEAAQKEAQRYPGSKLLKIGLRIGEWSGVDPESLRFCFEALVLGSEPSPAALDIEFRSRQNRCPTCGTVFALKDYQTDCPNCGAAVTEPVSGTELELAYVELEEP
jgi:hydrogenase nickel incorporation protein HypA/HybF